jgi:hypothetical protein
MRQVPFCEVSVGQRFRDREIPFNQEDDNHPVRKRSCERPENFKTMYHSGQVPWWNAIDVSGTAAGKSVSVYGERTMVWIE